MKTVTINYPGILGEITGTSARDWMPDSDCPESRCGNDYLYVHPVQGEAYINNDQGWVEITLGGNKLYSGFLEDDTTLDKFVKES